MLHITLPLWTSKFDMFFPSTSVGLAQSDSTCALAFSIDVARVEGVCPIYRRNAAVKPEVFRPQSCQMHLLPLRLRKLEPPERSCKPERFLQWHSVMISPSDSASLAVREGMCAKTRNRCLGHARVSTHHISIPLIRGFLSNDISTSG